MTRAYASRALLAGLPVLAALVAALAGCHLIYPFATTSPDGGGAIPDGSSADHGLVDRSITPERQDTAPSSERAGDCCPPGDQTPPTCPTGAPLVMTPISPAPLVSATQAFSASCKSGDKLTAVTLYALGACPASPLIGEVVSKLLSGTQGTVTEQDGADMTQAQLQGTFFFKATPCTGGPALLSAVSGFCGGSAFVGWHGESQVPCQNCTQFVVLTVILCPAAKKVVVLEGTYGWDS